MQISTLPSLADGPPASRIMPEVQPDENQSMQTDYQCVIMDPPTCVGYSCRLRLVLLPSSPIHKQIKKLGKMGGPGGHLVVRNIFTVREYLIVCG